MKPVCIGGLSQLRETTIGTVAAIDPVQLRTGSGRPIEEHIIPLQQNCKVIHGADTFAACCNMQSCAVAQWQGITVIAVVINILNRGTAVLHTDCATVIPIGTVILANNVPVTGHRTVVILIIENYLESVRTSTGVIGHINPGDHKNVLFRQALIIDLTTG